MKARGLPGLTVLVALGACCEECSGPARGAWRCGAGRAAQSRSGASPWGWERRSGLVRKLPSRLVEIAPS
eukprot:4633815-Pyramimonas_sp.AAC.1